MLRDKSVWKLACELAETGDFANVVMIERELLRRGIREPVTSNAFKREFLTRLCHAAKERGGAAAPPARVGLSAMILAQHQAQAV